jgi:hypothetical protein
MSEPESIISWVIARGIREEPELAAAEMLRLIRAEAELQAENAMLKARLGQLLGLEQGYGWG